jgi:hypothetical protein
MYFKQADYVGHRSINIGVLNTVVRCRLGQKVAKIG